MNNPMPEAIAKAITEFQSTLEDLKKDAQGQRSNYSSIGAMMTLVKKAAVINGIGISMPTRWCEGAGWHIAPIITHKSGVSWEGDMKWPLSVDDMTNSQKLGSALSYGRRYLLQGMLGLASGIADTEFDEDDDGEINGALKDPPKGTTWPSDAAAQDQLANSWLNQMKQISNKSALEEWNKKNSEASNNMQKHRPDLFEIVGAAYVNKMENF